MKKVLFACTHNAGRSQMAAAFFTSHANSAKAYAVSAGTNPGESVHPEVLEVMKEEGIDLSGTKPQKLTPEIADGAAFLITMGCSETCPVVPGAEIVDWSISDPKGQPIERVREIRDEVRTRVEKFIAEHDFS